ncbi:GFA family protein [Pelagibius litoralis]|uniref:GFA family protein n=1 Tax=Pelagibius litoralis TaxID=374515 RepID=A0A967C5A9_9PROT|nr:GFA family protein [Pelagibius litoralis]NIA67676.1 GFA family protein [Pelagibius litoralis]
MNDRVETGSCFCGAIAAELRGEPFWITYDHDDDCRRATGGPLTVWIGVRPAQFRFTRGTPKTFSKTPGVTRSFCADCGTSIGYRDDGTANELYLSIGFMDAPERFPPQAHAFWRQRLPWVVFADNLPCIDGYSRERDPAVGYPIDRKCG